MKSVPCALKSRIHPTGGVAQWVERQLEFPRSLRPRGRSASETALQTCGRGCARVRRARPHRCGHGQAERPVLRGQGCPRDGDTAVFVFGDVLCRETVSPGVNPSAFEKLVLASVSFFILILSLLTSMCLYISRAFLVGSTRSGLQKCLCFNGDV